MRTEVKTLEASITGFSCGELLPNIKTHFDENCTLLGKQVLDSNSVQGDGKNLN
jgi:hypothetical protein